MNRIPDKLSSVISVDPKTLGGEPVFKDTRVPVRSLFEHLRAGDDLETFLDDFPGVSREQVEAVLEYAEHQVVQPLEAA
jgi:uncharacterized protein (DUF433 family)